MQLTSNGNGWEREREGEEKRRGRRKKRGNEEKLVMEENAPTVGMEPL
jgi:hypothetical protein